MKAALPILFGLLALIHILPALSALAPSRLAGLYGVAPDNTVMLTLLQHRAALFGLVAAACIWAIFVPSVRPAVLIGTVISMASFIIIAAARGTMSSSLNKIVVVDAAGLIIAAIAAILLLRG
jgi:hypothetical protein